MRHNSLHQGEPLQHPDISGLNNATFRSLPTVSGDGRGVINSQSLFIIESLEDPARRVYLKRLQLCRDLYAFLLQTKEQERQSRPKP